LPAGPESAPASFDVDPLLDPPELDPPLLEPPLDDPPLDDDAVAPLLDEVDVPLAGVVGDDSFVGSLLLSPLHATRNAQMMTRFIGPPPSACRR